MANNTKFGKYVSPLVERNASEEMAELFGAQKKFSTWRRLWLELAKAQKKLGLNIKRSQIRQMAKLADESKVRYLGASNLSIEQIERIRRIHTVACLQPPYSMPHREAEDALLQYCIQLNIGVIAYSPMQRGLLTGKFSQERLAGLALDDHRRRNPDSQELRFSAALELVEDLKKMPSVTAKPAPSSPSVGSCGDGRSLPLSRGHEDRSRLLKPLLHEIAT